MKVILKFLFFFLFVQFIGAQNTIKGVITDPTGQPLPGATILIKGTQTGVSSGFEGDFRIEASKGDVLEISFVGFLTKTITVDDRTEYTITLEDDTALLDEVVVVGYGKQKKVNNTGAVQTVTFKEEVNQPVTNSGQLLYGRFSGVQLTQGSGNPGADGSSIVIRGIGTFGGTTPLIVIDNIQYDSLAAFNNLSPADIESISVLKDASSLSIYGARGANGVVIVTTRRGISEKFEVSYNGFYGVQQATVKPKFLGALDYANLINEKFRNQDGPSFDPRYTDQQIQAIQDNSLPNQFGDTNWVDEILTTAPISNHNISMSGGSGKTTYRASIGYLTQEAIIKSKFKNERYTLSLNLNSKLKDWLNLSIVSNSFWRRIEGPTGGQSAFSGDNGIIYSFQRTAPTIPLFYDNGQYGTVDGAFYNDNPSKLTQNPLRRGFFGNFNSDNINTSNRLGLTFNITKDLTFETSGSANIIYTNASDFTPTFQLNDFNGDFVLGSDLNQLVNNTNLDYTLLNENILRFNKTFNSKHIIGALFGHSVIYSRGDNFRGQLSGFPTNNIDEFNGGGIVEPAVSGAAFEEVTQSFFGRFSYNYDDRYLAEFNIRYDGSSKFGSDFLYGTFPSASIGWRISQEQFMEDVDWISNLKLRASYGLLGNNSINNYIFEQTYNPNIDYVLGDDNFVTGVALTTLANPFIRWEETAQLDIGVDLSMFKNQLQIEAGYFRRDNSDLLYTNFPIPNTLGVTNLGARNAAAMTNEGLELLVNYRGNLGDAKYSIGGNLTKLLNNEVTGLGDGGEETITNTNIIRIGEPIRAYYGYKAIGIFQSFDETSNAPSQFGSIGQPGDIRYADVSGPNGVPDGIVDADDRVIIGDPNPDLLLNFNGSIDYKGFDFNLLFQGVLGVDRLIMGNGNLPMVDDRSNVLDYWINRWTPENPSTDLPRVGGVNNAVVSSFYIQDASYLRLKNIELGYSFPKSLTEKLKIEKFRIFVGAQNLVTFTGLEYFDPERANGSQSNRNAPLTKTITFGVNLKL